MQMEIWKEIKGYEGYYEVSSAGNVRRVGRHFRKDILFPERLDVPIIMKQHLSRCGYLMVPVSKGKTKHVTVHRLMAIAFIDNPDPSTKTIVNHINGIKSDNRIENLEWCTYKENTIHGWKNKLNRPNIGEANGGSKLSEDDVRNIRRLFDKKMRIRDVMSLYGMSRSCITDIKTRVSWAHVK